MCEHSIVLPSSLKGVIPSCMSLHIANRGERKRSTGEPNSYLPVDSISISVSVLLGNGNADRTPARPYLGVLPPSRHIVRSYP